MPNPILHHSTVGDLHHYALFSPANAQRPCLQVLSETPLIRTADYVEGASNTYEIPVTKKIATLDLLTGKTLIRSSPLFPWVILSSIFVSPSALATVCIIVLAVICFILVRYLKAEWLPIIEEVHAARRNAGISGDQENSHLTQETNSTWFSEVRRSLVTEAENENAVILPPRFPQRFSPSAEGVKYDILLYNSLHSSQSKEAVLSRLQRTLALLAGRKELRRLLSLKRTVKPKSESMRRIQQHIAVVTSECESASQDIERLTSLIPTSPQTNPNLMRPIGASEGVGVHV